MFLHGPKNKEPLDAAYQFWDDNAWSAWIFAVSSFPAPFPLFAVKGFCSSSANARCANYPAFSSSSSTASSALANRFARCTYATDPALEFRFSR